jgi:hypothetical protein
VLRKVTCRYPRFQAVTGGCNSAQHQRNTAIPSLFAGPIVAALVDEVFAVLIVLDGAHDAEENDKHLDRGFKSGERYRLSLHPIFRMRQLVCLPMYAIALHNGLQDSSP